MARSKHSRALFEVIKQAQQRQQKQSAQPARSATAMSWWPFGKRARAASPRLALTEPVMRSTPAAPAVPAEPLPPTDEPPTQQPAHAALAPGCEEVDSAEQTPQTGGADDTAIESEQRIARAIVAAPGSRPAREDDPQPPAELEESAPLTTPSARPRQREVQLALSYSTVGIAALAGLVLLITAFVAGKHFARPTSSAGPGLVQIRNGRTFPEVLNVNPGQTKATLATADGKPADEPAPPPRRAVAAAEPPGAAQRAGAATPAGATPAGATPAGATPTADQQRVIGRNYIIAQSYPDSDLAGKAAALLAKNDIPVSVEQLDFAPGWYCVVTRVGFDRPSSPEYQRYEKMIRDINAQAAAARIKKFDPYPYKWK